MPQIEVSGVRNFNPKTIDRLSRLSYNMILLGDNMARITSEKASKAVGSKYDLILIASRRVRELRHGHAPMIADPHRSEIITALREIEQGVVGRDYLLKNPNIDRETKRKSR